MSQNTLGSLISLSTGSFPTSLLRKTNDGRQSLLSLYPAVGSVLPTHVPWKVSPSLENPG